MSAYTPTNRLGPLDPRAQRALLCTSELSEEFLLQAPLRTPEEISLSLAALEKERNDDKEKVFEKFAAVFSGKSKQTTHTYTSVYSSRVTSRAPPHYTECIYR